jgi:ribosomal subunit interface protein
MKLEIGSADIALTPALLAHVQHRVRTALGRRRDRIARVVVRLADENGPRGGVDKQCRIRAYLVGGPAVHIHQRASDLYAAIDLAADRAGQALARRAGRLVHAARGGARRARLTLVHAL